jgi:hypothetical protein
MERLFVSPKQDVVAVFGLRYLEEESAETNNVAGCLIIDDDGNIYPPPRTQYTTNCDYSDYD